MDYLYMNIKDVNLNMLLTQINKHSFNLINKVTNKEAVKLYNEFSDAEKNIIANWLVDELKEAKRICISVTQNGEDTTIGVYYLAQRLLKEIVNITESK